ncbi:olfactory receptor 8K1 [Cottoperca gobio]|uniref:Olfactory receptor 8K1 n=1 Tax=Cottoperca gobio TaxID=56716 RepID=A0A6J2Q2D0_COTGO|nr:olfactory receptor 8K1-like [Cottoperca gobio]
MPTAPVMTVAEAHNLTDLCNWFSGENRTEPRVTERVDAAGCLFLSILPHGQAVSVLIWIFVLLTLFSFLVNGFTLLGLGRSEDLSWEPRVALFKNLILSDLLQTFTFGPAVIHSLIQRRTFAFSTWCHIQYFVGTVSIFASLLTITCMALERYLYVCHAIHYLVILTQVRLRIALSLIWVYSIFVATINMVLLHIMGRGQNNEPVTSGLLCEPDMMEQYMSFPRASAVFRKCMGFFTLLLCLFVYAFSYIRMYQDARKAIIQFYAVNTTARKTVLFYCGMLLLQLLPLLLKVASDSLWEVEGTGALLALSTPTPSATAAALHMSLLVMLLVPPFINPLVYGLRNAEMRQALLSLFRWSTERRGAGERGVEEIRVEHIVHQNRAQVG